MKRLLENFQKLMEKFKFVESISPEIQRFVLSRSRSNLTSILKGVGNYSFLFGKILHIYYLAKKLGKKITFAQSKIILAFLSIYFISSIAVAGFYLSKSFKADRSSGEGAYKYKKHEEHKKILPGRKDKNKYDSKKDSASRIRALAGVENFLSRDKEASGYLTDTILKQLKRKLGNEKVVSLNKVSRKKVPRIILGSLRELGSSQIISVKIVNVETAKVEFSAYERVSSKKEYNRACRRLSEKLAGKIE